MNFPLVPPQPPKKEQSELLKVKEAAHLLGMSERALRQRMIRGGCPPFVRLSERTLRFRRSDVLAWLNGAEKHDPNAPIRSGIRG